MSHLKHGDKVRCLFGNIDRNLNKGEIGYVTGFARFSSYHPREVSISTAQSGGESLGWFWQNDVEKLGDQP